MAMRLPTTIKTSLIGHDGTEHEVQVTTKTTNKEFIGLLYHVLSQAVAKVNQQSRTFVTSTGATVILPSGVICNGITFDGNKYILTFSNESNL